jgi:hypothetical protein
MNAEAKPRHRHHWTDIPRRSELLLPFRQQCTSCLRLRDVTYSRGDIAAAIDRLLNAVLPPEFNREEALWPLIYEYAAATSRRDVADLASMQSDTRA